MERKIAQQYTAAPPSLPVVAAAPAAAGEGGASSGNWDAETARATASAVQAALPEGKVAPGDALAPAAGITLGFGCYALGSTAHASIVGTPQFLPSDSTSGLRTAGVLSVTPSRSASSTAVPMVGSIVLAKVTRVTEHMVHARILVVGDVAVGSAVEGVPGSAGFSGVVKRENCREGEVDKAVLADMFVPGDIIRASVISLGTRRSYFLATASVDTGVLSATSAAGHPLQPVAHDKMKCSVTGVREPRKVARVGF